MTSLYVATTGNDSNAGTLAAPFKTISAAEAHAQAGTEVIVRGGTYNESVQLNASGTASNYISVHPYSGETVTINGASKSADVVAINGNYVELKGFQINGGDHGVTAWDVHNAKISGNTISGAWKGGIVVGGDNPGGNYGSDLIQGNNVTNNVLQNTSLGKNGGWGSGITSTLSDNTIITGNNVSRNYGEGIDVYSSKSDTVSSNTVSDNFNVEIYINSAPNTIVTRNLSYSTGNAAYFSNSHPALGIGLATEPGAPLVASINNAQITNNIDVGSSYGFRWWNEGSAGTFSNSLVANNTFANETTAALQIDAYAGNTGNRVANNIFYKASGGLVVGGTNAGNAFDHNVWFGGSDKFAGVGDVLGDPKFAAPGTFTAAGYALSNTSPAKSAGAQLAGVTVDYSGASRAAPPSIGAIEAASPLPSTGSGSTSVPPSATGSDTLAITMSEDAYQGDAQAVITLDGKTIGGTVTVAALHNQGKSQTVTVAGQWGPGAHDVGVQFINDAYGGTATTDRNLYVSGVTLDGQASATAPATLLSNGTAHFATAASPLVLQLSEDAYQGDAQFTVSVDGKTLGGPQSVTSLHASGVSQNFAFTQAMAAGTHDVAVSFLNDAWGGTAATDRNLYVDAINVNGAAMPGTAASLLSASTQHFSVVVPA